MSNTPRYPGLAATVLALCASVLTAACGGGGGSEAPVQPTTPTTPTPPVGAACPAAEFVLASKAYNDRQCTFRFAEGQGNEQRTVLKTELIDSTEHVGSATARCTGGRWTTLNLSCEFDASAADRSLQTQVAAPTYPASSAQHATFVHLNQQRARCGFGLLSQHRALDQAAQSHSDYLRARVLEEGIGYFSRNSMHAEAAGKSGFTGEHAGNRAAFFGYDTNSGKSYQGSVLESIAVHTTAGGRAVDASDGTLAIRTLLASVYHMGELITLSRDVGIGVAAVPAPGATNAIYTTINMGWITHPQRTAEVLSYPCAGTVDASPTFVTETPDPITRHGLAFPAGTPILVEAQAGQVLTVKSASVAPAGGGIAYTAPTNLLVLTVDNDPRMASYNQRNRAFLVPHKPLVADTTYRVQLVLDVGGQELRRDYSFTTGKSVL